MTSAYEVKQTRAIVKTVSAGMSTFNICVSTICNSVNVNNVKPSVASSTFAVKPETNSVKSQRKPSGVQRTIKHVVPRLNDQSAVLSVAAALREQCQRQD